jgi:CRISPR-associated protein Cas2
MARRRFLVTYDVADDKRRNRVARTLDNHGDRLQFSVYRCELNPRELVQLRALLHRILHHGEDQVLLVDLGSADATHEPIDALGRPYQPQVRARIV